MTAEWGEWKEHDGGPQPVDSGAIVSVEFRIAPPEGTCIFGNPDCDFAGTWFWHHDGSPDDIIRYRIRKPRGLVILENLIADLPEEVRA